jgi:hypothetical protein
MTTMIDIAEPSMSFAVASQAEPGLRIRINFGVFAGRQATPAEIDRLAERLLEGLDSVTIVAEERHEIGHRVEASVEQICFELTSEQVLASGLERAAIEERLIAQANAWALACIADRHLDSVA